MVMAVEDATVEVEEVESGELLVCGATDWDEIGRERNKNKSGVSKFPDLPEPHRISSLTGIPISFIAAGCTSFHCMALAKDGRCFTWGRNENGQLGHGTQGSSLRSPTPVEGLAGKKCVWAASGRNHSVVITDTGLSFSWGSNKHGQLGLGNLRQEHHLEPVQCAVKVPPMTAVSCGGEFTCWITAWGPAAAGGGGGGEAATAAEEEDGAEEREEEKDVNGAKAEGGGEGSDASLGWCNFFTAGLPQYGQLGHGTDHEYNAKDSSVKLVYDPQPWPRPVKALKGKRVVMAACGMNHTVAVDAQGQVYTWGNGGYGRLGHREQKDEWLPKRIDTFQRANVVNPKTAVVAAGTAHSAVTAGGGQLYMWGRVKTNTDAWMYPKPVMDLSGWSLRSLDCGPGTNAVAAESSVITWGSALHQELGYGAKGQKSSANAKKVDSLEGLRTTQVAIAQGFSLFLVSSSTPCDKLPLYEDAAGGAEDATKEEQSQKEGAKEGKGGRGGKRKAPPKGKGKEAAKPNTTRRKKK